MFSCSCKASKSPGMLRERKKKKEQEKNGKEANAEILYCVLLCTIVQERAARGRESTSSPPTLSNAGRGPCDHGSGHRVAGLQKLHARERGFQSRYLEVVCSAHLPAARGFHVRVFQRCPGQYYAAAVRSLQMSTCRVYHIHFIDPGPLDPLPSKMHLKL